MFLSDALPSLTGTSAAIPELERFKARLLDGLQASPAERLVALLAAFLFKQLTVWDQAAVRGLPAEVLARVLCIDEAPLVLPPPGAQAVLVKRLDVQDGRLRSEAQAVEREALFSRLPAPRAILLCVLADPQDVAAALRLREQHRRARFTTVVLSWLDPAGATRVGPALAALPHRTIVEIASLGADGGPLTVQVVATGDGADEV